MKDFTNAHADVVRGISTILARDFHFSEFCAEELVSRTMEKLWKSAYDESRSFGPFAYSVALNVAKDIQAENARHQSMFCSFDRKNDEGEWEKNRFGGALSASRCDEASFHEEEVECNKKWNAFLAGLNETDRSILRLLVEQVRVNEIAERLGCRPNYVSGRIHKMKSRVRGAFAA
ncbi:MAG: sigma-70 family RNA polymerase sigma factor [Candidatus Cryptobacteroides sp.]